MNNLSPPSANPNNAELLIWCLFLVGGADKFVDVEDLYFKLFELAPARLSWRTRHDVPDYKKCAKALQEVEDQKRSRFNTFIIKNGPYQRKLSTDASAWCELYSAHFKILYSESIVPSAASQDDGRTLRSIESSDLYGKYLKDQSTELSLHAIADLFRCMPDANDAVWASRFDLAEHAAKRNGRDYVILFIHKCREVVVRESIK